MPRKLRKIVRKRYYKKQVVEHVPIDSLDGSGKEDVGYTSKSTHPATQTDYIT